MTYSSTTSTIKDRIIAFIQAEGISVRQFEIQCGLSNGSVSKMGDNPRWRICQQILTAFSQLSERWLLAGEGEMLKKQVELKDEVEDLTPEELQEVREGILNGSFRLVPLVNIDSVGGIHSENSITPSEQYVLKMMPFTEAREGDVAILQTGNSMYPTIPAGSALLIREVVDWREYFGYGSIYVLWLRDGRRITKEIRRYDADPSKYVWCVSYNPDVADEELPVSMIRGVWKVVKYLADFGW